MKIYRKRIPFGAEKILVQAGEQSCAHCGTSPGRFHLGGCSAEECPQCAKALIGCCCECLSPHDGELIINGLYFQFSDLESALQAAGEEESCPAGGTSSYLQHAVMKYIFDNVPETAKTEITRAFHLRFPGLVPALKDEDGRGYYTAEQLSRALDMPIEEVNERINAMLTTGRTILPGEGRKLQKIH